MIDNKLNESRCAPDWLVEMAMLIFIIFVWLEQGDFLSFVYVYIEVNLLLLL